MEAWETGFAALCMLHAGSLQISNSAIALIKLTPYTSVPRCSRRLVPVAVTRHHSRPVLDWFEAPMNQKHPMTMLGSTRPPLCRLVEVV